MPINAPTEEPTAHPTQCNPLPDCKFTLSEDNLILNNLGDLSQPNKPPVMLFKKVCPDSGKEVTLKIENTSAYTPFRISRTGFWKPYAYANINLKYPTEVELKFSFTQDGSSKPLPVDFYFTVMDLDHPKGAKEQIEVGDYDFYTVSQDTKLKVKELDNDPKYAVRITSDHEAGAENNPKDPMHLSQEAEQVSASFYFKNITDFHIKMKVLSTGNFDHTGRNFFFTGQTSLSNVCMQPTTKTTTTTTTENNSPFVPWDFASMEHHLGQEGAQVQEGTEHRSEAEDPYSPMSMEIQSHGDITMPVKTGQKRTPTHSEAQRPQKLQRMIRFEPRASVDKKH